MSFFEITHTEKHTRARTGIIHTDHGDIETPMFMPVGTQATVKSLDPVDIAQIGAQIILGNTYHLHLRPGEDLIASFGGLHKFMQWQKPILTDSGGFQVFSLGAQRDKKERPTDDGNDQGKLVQIDDDGVTFRSHIDGSTHRFTPEIAIDIQHKLGADIIMAFDECTPDDADVSYTAEAMERTHAWAKRSLDAHKKNTAYHEYRQFLFGIIQGANHKELREASAKEISRMDFDGIAIGGESIGYNMQATADILDWVYPFIPEEKPKYTMGLGFSPLDLFDVVERGVDIFDCVAPTRMARNGSLFVHPETMATCGPVSRTLRINITNAQFRNDMQPIDPKCVCSVCTTFTRAYLYHLFAANELLAYRLATIHNLTFFLNLMKNMRLAIRNDQFLKFKEGWLH
ncbi:MAG TPA: tRNA guanosine(34) transglycosylase Tgt [Candidatus Kapabacteria bacterium]|nr:tRNA guanosine(34) transglycosylase Tgt [Candidatus Kapabacteria bacterium]